MNAYFNKDEKESFIRMTILYGLVERDIKNYAEKSKSPDKKYLKGMRTALTWLRNTLDYRKGFLSLDAAKAFSRSLDDLDFLVTTRDKAKKEYKKIAEMQSYVHMDINDFYDWAECTIPFQCGMCSHEKRWKKCRIRKIFMKYDMLPVNTAAVDSCQFSYPDAGLKIEDVYGKLANTAMTFFDNEEKKE